MVGALYGLDWQSKADGRPPDLRFLWILRAQKGTLEKLGTFLPEDREHSSAELLMIARNLFENLVWLKLFNLDPEYGVIFYGQFLKQHIEDAAGMLAKVKAEATLFLGFDAEDQRITSETYTNIGKSGRPIKDELAERQAEHDRRLDELDRRVRRGFALHAAQARRNGYGFQAHLIETKDVPTREVHLAKIRQHMADFEAEVQDPARIARAKQRWNWKDEARRVGMVDQYEFLYAWTSRLLHSTPMNLITEKELFESEQTMLLEYIVVTLHDLLDEIEKFDFPGRVNVAAFELG